MNVLIDEEEEGVRDAARQVLSAEAPPELARAMEKNELGYSPELWHKLGSLGWMGLSLPEEYGGEGLPLTYTGILLSEVGRHIAPVPLHSTVVASQIIARFGSDEQKRRYLPDLATGKSIGTFAFQERDGAITPEGIELQATVDGDDLVLSGTKSFVDDFLAADLCVVVARSQNSGDPYQGVTVVVIDSKVEGLEVVPLVTTAKDRQYLVSFNQVHVQATNVLGEISQGWEVARDLLDHGAALLCAQMVGATRRDMEFGIEYSKLRHAFGRPIGSFQAIQHMAADMVNAVDASELLTFEAIWRLGVGLSASVEASQAKSFASERCIFVCRCCQQIHGGMGFMMEFDLQLWYRRVAAWSLRLGSSYDHRARIEHTLLDGDSCIRLGESVALVEPARS